MGGKEDIRILVDMDDVIENLSVAWIDFLNRKYGTSVDRESVRDWDMMLSFPTIPESELYGALEEEALWNTVTPKKDASKYLKRLRDDGHEIYIVTTSGYKTVRVKMEKVLFKYFPWISWDQVIITSNKQIIKGDILVDDAPHNLIGGEYTKILFDMPYNRNFKAEEHGVIRVYSWEQVYEIIYAMAERPVGVIGVRQHTAAYRNDEFDTEKTEVT